MSRFRFVALCAVVCSLFVVGHSLETPTSQKPEVIDLSSPQPINKNTTSTEATTTTTTPETTTSTTPKPTTSTTTPSTTTSSTTTPAPPAPTPAPKPSPVPEPTQGTWWYTDDKNVTCIGVQFAAQLNVSYTKQVNNASSIESVILNVPANATVANGTCGASSQLLKLSWTAPNTTEPNNFTLTFYKNSSTNNYNLQAMNISLTSQLFVNASSVNASVPLSHGSDWLTPVATSYRCAPATQLTLLAAEVDAAAITISHLQEEAFRSVPGKGFSAARECGGGDVPDAVPIAVGCALGGLVVVVLVAYLVGRRRSAARGYLSM